MSVLADLRKLADSPGWHGAVTPTALYEVAIERYTDGHAIQAVPTPALLRMCEQVIEERGR